MDDTTNPGVLAWAALLRCQAALVPRLSEHVQAEAGIPLSWYDVLLELASAPDERLRIQQLGERVVLSRSRVSRIVDEMERAGLVRREADPQDGRASLAVSTDEGTAAFRRARPVYLDAIEQLFARHLTATEQEVMTAALTRVVTDAAARPRPGGRGDGPV